MNGNAYGQHALGRRGLIAGAAGVALATGLGAGAARAGLPGAVDVSGWDLPGLSFTMTDATSAREVTARDFLGKVVLLYFGYTHCTDVCPMTLHNIAVALGRLGAGRDQVQALFVTVDPDRDTLPLLRQFTGQFAPEIVGLRGTADQLARLASRYHIAYSVRPETALHPYDVNHSSAIYVFDRRGQARLLIPSLDSSTSDVAGTAARLARLLGEAPGKPARLSR